MEISHIKHMADERSLRNSTPGMIESVDALMNGDGISVMNSQIPFQPPGKST
jgi:hypothetical protein